MAIVYVQSAAGDDPTTALAYGSNVGAGSLLIACIRRGSGGAPTSLSGGGTWVASVATGFDVAGDHNISLWYCANAAGGATTVTQTGGSGSSRMVIYEFSGIATASPEDVTATTNAASNTTPTCTSFTTATADTVLIGAFTNASAVTYSAGAGFTLPGTAFTTKNAMVYQIVSSTNSYAPNGTTNISDLFGAIGSAFKISSGGGGPAGPSEDYWPGQLITPGQYDPKRLIIL